MIDRYRFSEQPMDEPPSLQWPSKSAPYPDLPERKPQPARSIEPYDSSWLHRNRPVQAERPYEGPDRNGDGVADEIASWMSEQQASPEDRKLAWVEENVWNPGLTVDEATGEIIDPETGQAVGRLPNFG
jgi:hypothetical protein